MSAKDQHPCKKYLRTQNDRDFPVECPGVKYAYGAFANTTYGNGKGFQNLKERKGMAAIVTASASIDELWDSMEEEEVSFSFDEFDPVKVKRRKSGTRYPFGKTCTESGKKVDLKTIEDDELEKFVYGSTRRYYDVMESVAVQKASAVPGIGILSRMTTRDKFFDMLYVIENNPLGTDELAIVLNCDKELIQKLIFTGCSLGMCFYYHSIIRRFEIKLPDGSSEWKTKKHPVISIGGWGIIDKNLFLKGSRQFGLKGMDLSRAKMPEDARQRQKVLDELHKISIGLRSKYDDDIAYNMDELGKERNGFRRSERVGVVYKKKEEPKPL